jgi:endoplasmic reticulum junction formation protein lunapark
VICYIVRELPGLARKEDFPHVTYYCPHCHALNRSNESIGQCPVSDSGQLRPVVAADGASTRDGIAETEMSSTTEVQERQEELGAAGHRPVDPAN